MVTKEPKPPPDLKSGPAPAPGDAGQENELPPKATAHALPPVLCPQQQGEDPDWWFAPSPFTVD